MNPLTERQTRLFWEKVNKTDTCWLWTASVGWNGYGMFGKPTKRAHLVALHLAGIVLKPGEFGLHKCNNPRCIRVHPEHVYPGTHKQNMKDRKDSGFKPTVPWVPGSLNGSAKLQEAEVLEIRKNYTDGSTGRAKRLTVQDLSEMYCVSASQVKRIINRQSWRHV